MYSSSMIFSKPMLIYYFQVQFIGLAGHTIIFLCLNDCDYPSGMKIIHITYMMTLTLLFSNFYVQSYLKKGKKNPQTSRPDFSTNDDKKLQ